MGVVIHRFDVFLVRLDPTQGHELRKTRPAVIISPDEMNRQIQTVLIAPMTTASKAYPSRVPIVFQGRSGQIVLDRIRVIDRSRLVRRLGHVTGPTATHVLEVLAQLFAP
jgi:mRNA interferase MazF